MSANQIIIDPKRVRAMQVIAGALITGSTVFALIAMFITVHPDAQGKGLPIVAIVMAGMAVAEIVPFFVVPRAMQSQLRNEAVAGDDQQQAESLAGMYQMQMIIKYALLEGASFANCIGYMVDGQWWSLAVVGALTLAMLLMFPTQTKIEHWIETQLMRTHRD